MPGEPTSHDKVAALRARVAAVSDSTAPVLAFGADALDDRLARGGLETDVLHEVAPASSTLADDAAATLFLAGVAARLADVGRGHVLWSLTRFDLYAPGLEQAGLTADALLFAQAKDDQEALALAEDGARAGSLAAVVVEVRKVGMVATRRLQLAAADGRTPVLLLRRWRRSASCPLAEPSAAATRWRIGCAPSVRLGVPGVGRAVWSIEVVRQRGGAAFSVMLEACDDQGRLAPSAPTRHRAAPASGASVRAA